MIEQIDASEFERTYKLDNERIITLKIDEGWTEISFWENGRRFKSSGFEFSDVEEDQSEFHLRWMYVPAGLKRCGLGTVAICFHREMTSNAIIFTTEPHLTNQDVDDGSQLTEDAIPFIRAMQKLGYIRRWQSDIDTEID